MTTRAVLVAFAILPISACNSAEPQAPPLTPDARFGIASYSGDTLCLAIENSGLTPGAEIQLSDGEHVWPGTIAATHPEPCRFPDSAANISGYYTITVPAEFKRGTVAIASIAPDKEKVHSCTSAEGIHFTVWSGEPITGELLWHYYYYLGYDTEPTCANPGEWGQKTK